MVSILKCFSGLMLVCALHAAADAAIVKSPSGNLTADAAVCGDHVGIAVMSGGDTVLQMKTFQFKFENVLAQSLQWKLVDSKMYVENETWRPVCGERSTILNHYTEMEMKLLGSGGRHASLFVRVYDQGVAVKYGFDAADFADMTLTDEETVFLFNHDIKTWVSNNAQSPCGEKVLSAVKDAVDRPLVAQLSAACYIAVGEAGLVDFSRMKLKKGTENFSLRSVLSGKVNMKKAGYASPWRYVMIGTTPANLLQYNDLILNLNEPCAIQDTAWIKPGNVLREVTLTTKGGLACVDFAAKNNIAYVEFDAGWYGPEDNRASDASTVTVDPKRSSGPLDLQAVIDYAKTKNVGIILYVNMKALKKQLDQILPLYQQWGVKGIKYGFVDVGDQWSTSFVHEAVRKAAKHQLMIDIHDEYRPTGYSRTYPNLITQEGIRGDEESPPMEQALYTLFTRMIAGAGDYTNCYFAPRVTNGKMGGKAAQLAKKILIYSPWQFIYWYDRPMESVSKVGGAGAAESVIRPDSITSFYQQIPTVWDDTRILDGVIGKRAVVARKSGDDWYIGALCAKAKTDFSISLDFLDPNTTYEATIYTQLPDGSVGTRSLTLKKETPFAFSLESNSGCAVYLRKK